MAMKPQTIFFFSILVVTLQFAGCSGSNKTEQAPSARFNASNDKTQTEPAVETEAASVTNTLVTFSTANDLMKKYPMFKLGMYDVVLYVNTDEGLKRVSLRKKTPTRVSHFDKVKPVDLSYLKSHEHLFWGAFQVPEGTVEAAELIISGQQTEIVIGNKSPLLIDAFFSAYQLGDANLLKNDFPAKVYIRPNSSIRLKASELTTLNFKIDQNITASLDPLENPDLTIPYARFTPSAELSELSGTVPVRIKEVNALSFLESSLVIGNPEEFFISLGYRLKPSANLYKDGVSISGLSQSEGIYAMDISGSFELKSDSVVLDIQQAYLGEIADSNDSMMLEGYVNVEGDTVTINGSAQKLQASNTSLLGAERFNKIINNLEGSVQSGQIVKLWHDTGATKVIEAITPQNLDNKTLLSIQATLSLTPADLLGVKSALVGSSSFTLVMPEATNCTDYISQINGQDPVCEGKLSQIMIPFNGSGTYTLHETRLGDISSDNLEFSLEADRVNTFRDAKAFTTFLSQKVSSERFRVSSLSATGAFSDGVFQVDRNLSVVLLKPVNSIDAVADAWIAEQKRNNESALGDSKDKNIGLYAGLGIAGVASAGAVALIVKRLYDQGKLSFLFNSKKNPLGQKRGLEGSAVSLAVNQSEVNKLLKPVVEMPLTQKIVNDNEATPKLDTTSDELTIVLDDDANKKPIEPIPVKSTKSDEGVVYSVDLLDDGLEAQYQLAEGSYFVRFADKNGLPIEQIEMNKQGELFATEWENGKKTLLKIVSSKGEVNKENGIKVDQLISQRPTQNSIPEIYSSKGHKMMLTLALPIFEKGVISDDGLRIVPIDLNKPVQQIAGGYMYNVDLPDQKSASLGVFMKFDGSIEFISDSEKLKTGTNVLFTRVIDGPVETRLKKAGFGAAFQKGANNQIVFDTKRIKNNEEVDRSFWQGTKDTSQKFVNWAASIGFDVLPKGEALTLDQYNAATERQMFYVVRPSEEGIDLGSILKSGTYYADNVKPFPIKSYFQPATASTTFFFDDGRASIHIDAIKYKKPNETTEGTIDLTRNANGVLALDGNDLVLIGKRIVITEGQNDDDFAHVSEDEIERRLLGTFDEITGKFTQSTEFETLDFSYRSISKKTSLLEGLRWGFETRVSQYTDEFDEFRVLDADEIKTQRLRMLNPEKDKSFVEKMSDQRNKLSASVTEFWRKFRGKN